MTIKMFGVNLYALGWQKKTLQLLLVAEPQTWESAFTFLTYNSQTSWRSPYWLSKRELPTHSPGWVDGVNCWCCCWSCAPVAEFTQELEDPEGWPPTGPVLKLWLFTNWLRLNELFPVPSKIWLPMPGITEETQNRNSQHIKVVEELRKI